MRDSSRGRTGRKSGGRINRKKNPVNAKIEEKGVTEGAFNP